MTWANAETQALLVGLLEDFARRVVAAVGDNLDWHVESPQSEIYEVNGILPFTSRDDPTSELVVVTIEFRPRPTAEWTFDVIDRDARILAFSRLSVADDRAGATLEPLVKAREFLDKSASLVMAELSGRPSSI